MKYHTQKIVIGNWAKVDLETRNPQKYGTQVVAKLLDVVSVDFFRSKAYGENTLVKVKVKYKGKTRLAYFEENVG
jgi:hypothetical protein